MAKKKKGSGRGLAGPLGHSADAVPQGRTPRVEAVPPSMASHLSTNGIPKKRVTFVIPANLDDGLELYCVAAKRLKNEAVAIALAEFLQGRRDELMQFLRAATVPLLLEEVPDR